MSGKTFSSAIPVPGHAIANRKTSSPAQNGGSLQSQAAGSEIRPGSYAAPPNTIGLPSVPSPLPSSSSTSSSKSQNSKISQNQGSSIPMLTNQTNGIKSPVGRQHIPQVQPPPPLKLRQDSNSNLMTTNGLLSTIEQAAHSDEEPTSPPALPPSHLVGTMFPATTREAVSSPRGPGAPSNIPLSSRPSTASPQPNYENISAPVSRQGNNGHGFATGIPKVTSPIPNKDGDTARANFKGVKHGTPSDRISTAQLVATSRRGETLSNQSSLVPLKKTSLPQTSFQGRSPSPKFTASNHISSRITSPLSSNPKLDSPTSHSNGGIPVHKTSLPILSKNASLNSSRIPLPK